MRNLATLGAAVFAMLLSTGAAAQTYPSTDTPLLIPDNNPGGVTSTLTVPAGGPTIGDLDILFTATHSWIGDLVATVTHGATSVAFLDRPGFTGTGFGCSGENPDVGVDDEGTDGALESGCVNGLDPGYPVPGGHYTPNSPLSAFDGQSVSGTWTLVVSDNAAADTGTLDSWSLIVTPAVANEPGAGRNNDALTVTGANPATSRAQLALQVADGQDVRVVLYDLLGRAVRTAFEGQVVSGATVYIDVYVADLRSGVYLVRAEGDRLQATRAITVR